MREVVDDLGAHWVEGEGVGDRAATRQGMGNDALPEL